MRTNYAIQRATAWVRDQLAAHTLAEVEGQVSIPKIVAFSLSHQAGGVVRTETGARVMVGQGIDPSYVAEFFFEKATAYASGLTGGSGMQQFVIEAHAEGQASPIAQYPMKATGVQEGDGVMSTEPATSTGLMTQLMRHTEFAMGAMARMNEQLLMTNAQLVADSQNTIRKGYENLELTEALITRAAEGEHQKKLELMQLKSREDMKAKLLTMAPAGINAVFEKEIFPTAMADTGIIESLAEGMSADDLQMFAMVLQAKVKNKEVLGLFFNRLNKIIEEKQSKEALNGDISAPTQQ